MPRGSWNSNTKSLRSGPTSTLSPLSKKALRAKSRADASKKRSSRRRKASIETTSTLGRKKTIGEEAIADFEDTFQKFRLQAAGLLNRDGTPSSQGGLLSDRSDFSLPSNRSDSSTGSGCSEKRGRRNTRLQKDRSAAMLLAYGRNADDFEPAPSVTSKVSKASRPRSVQYNRQQHKQGRRGSIGGRSSVSVSENISNHHPKLSALDHKKLRAKSANILRSLEPNIADARARAATQIRDEGGKFQGETVRSPSATVNNTRSAQGPFNPSSSKDQGIALAKRAARANMNPHSIASKVTRKHIAKHHGPSNHRASNNRSRRDRENQTWSTDTRDTVSTSTPSFVSTSSNDGKRRKNRLHSSGEMVQIDDEWSNSRVTKRGLFDNEDYNDLFARVQARIDPMPASCSVANDTVQAAILAAERFNQTMKDPNEGMALVNKIASEPPKPIPEPVIQRPSHSVLTADGVWGQGAKSPKSVSCDTRDYASQALAAFEQFKSSRVSLFQERMKKCRAEQDEKAKLRAAVEAKNEEARKEKMKREMEEFARSQYGTAATSADDDDEANPEKIMEQKINQVLADLDVKLGIKPKQVEKNKTDPKICNSPKHVEMVITNGNEERTSSQVSPDKQHTRTVMDIVAETESANKRMNEAGVSVEHIAPRHSINEVVDEQQKHDAGADPENEHGESQVVTLEKDTFVAGQPNSITHDTNQQESFTPDTKIAAAKRQEEEQDKVLLQVASNNQNESRQNQNLFDRAESEIHDNDGDDDDAETEVEIHGADDAETEVEIHDADDAETEVEINHSDDIAETELEIYHTDDDDDDVDPEHPTIPAGTNPEARDGIETEINDEADNEGDADESYGLDDFESSDEEGTLSPNVLKNDLESFPERMEPSGNISQSAFSLDFSAIQEKKTKRQQKNVGNNRSLLPSSTSTEYEIRKSIFDNTVKIRQLEATMQASAQANESVRPGTCQIGRSKLPQRPTTSCGSSSTSSSSVLGTPEAPNLTAAENAIADCLVIAAHDLDAQGDSYKDDLIHMPDVDLRDSQNCSSKSIDRDVISPHSCKHVRKSEMVSTDPIQVQDKTVDDAAPSSGENFPEGDKSCRSPTKTVVPSHLPENFEPETDDDTESSDEDDMELLTARSKQRVLESRRLEQFRRPASNPLRTKLSLAPILPRHTLFLLLSETIFGSASSPGDDDKEEEIFYDKNPTFPSSICHIVASYCTSDFLGEWTLPLESHHLINGGMYSLSIQNNQGHGLHGSHTSRRNQISSGNSDPIRFTAFRSNVGANEDIRVTGSWCIPADCEGQEIKLEYQHESSNKLLYVVYGFAPQASSMQYLMEAEETPLDIDRMAKLTGFNDHFSLDMFPSFLIRKKNIPIVDLSSSSSLLSVSRPSTTSTGLPKMKLAHSHNPFPSRKVIRPSSSSATLRSRPHSSGLLDKSMSSSKLNTHLRSVSAKSSGNRRNRSTGQKNGRRRHNPNMPSKKPSLHETGWNRY